MLVDTIYYCCFRLFLWWNGVFVHERSRWNFRKPYAEQLLNGRTHSRLLDRHTPTKVHCSMVKKKDAIMQGIVITLGQYWLFLYIYSDVGEVVSCRVFKCHFFM